MAIEDVYDNCMKRFTSNEKYDVNMKYIDRFVNSCDAQGLSVHTKLKYLVKIKYISNVIKEKDFKKWDRNDVEAVFTKLNKECKPWTVNSYAAFFKRYWRYIFDLSSKDKAPQAVDWIVKELPESDILPEDLLTKNDIKKMINSTNSIKWKALIAVMCSGCRPREILSITKDKVHITSGLMKIYVESKLTKNKKSKYRPCYPGYWIKNQHHKEIISEWLRDHPSQDKSDSLFPNLSYAMMNKAVKTISRKALGKSIKLYLTRHSFATWAYQSFPTPVARKLVGHSPNSTMDQFYLHMSEQNLEDILTGKKRIEQEDDPEEVDNDFNNAEEILNIASKLPEFQELVLKSIKLWKEKNSL